MMMSNSEINIPGYTLHAEIGRGGMATVYEATQDSLGRKVAIKILHDQGDASFNDRFINEAHFIASLNNPHIITIFDIAKVDDGDNYIAMEYLPGGDLKDNLEKYQNADKALTLVEHIATGLIEVHEKGIVHRDIKPANILFRENGDAVLTDFGIAKCIKDDSDLTQAGFSLGSPSYSSPEQIQGKPLGVTSDIYSLGVILLELVMGKNLFKGESHGGTAINHIQMPVPTLPDGAKLLEGLLIRLLAKKPEDRYSSCAELLKAISTLKESRDYSAFVGGVKKKAVRGAGRKSGSTKVYSDTNKASKLGAFKYVMALSLAVSILGFAYFFFVYESETQKQINALLAEAEIRVEMGSYIHPENDNARYYYRQILLLDENNRQALKGIQSVEEIQIAQFLQLGANAIEEQRLDSPKANNAVYYFNQILILDEDNAAANSGLEQVVQEYGKIARMKLLNREYRHATNYINRGLSLSPENEELLLLREEVMDASPSARKRLRGVINKLRDTIR